MDMETSVPFFDRDYLMSYLDSPMDIDSDGEVTFGMNGKRYSMRVFDSNNETVTYQRLNPEQREQITDLALRMLQEKGAIGASLDISINATGVHLAEGMDFEHDDRTHYYYETFRSILEPTPPPPPAAELPGQEIHIHSPRKKKRKAESPVPQIMVPPFYPLPYPSYYQPWYPQPMQYYPPPTEFSLQPVEPDFGLEPVEQDFGLQPMKPNDFGLEPAEPEYGLEPVEPDGFSLEPVEPDFSLQPVENDDFGLEAVEQDFDLQPVEANDFGLEPIEPDFGLELVEPEHDLELVPATEEELAALDATLTALVTDYDLLSAEVDGSGSDAQPMDGGGEDSTVPNLDEQLRREAQLLRSLDELRAENQEGTRQNNEAIARVVNELAQIRRLIENFPKWPQRALPRVSPPPPSPLTIDNSQPLPLRNRMSPRSSPVPRPSPPQPSTSSSSSSSDDPPPPPAKPPMPTIPPSLPHLPITPPILPLSPPKYLSVIEATMYDKFKNICDRRKGSRQTLKFASPRDKSMIKIDETFIEQIGREFCNSAIQTENAQGSLSPLRVGQKAAIRDVLANLFKRVRDPSLPPWYFDTRGLTPSIDITSRRPIPGQFQIDKQFAMAVGTQIFEAPEETQRAFEKADFDLGTWSNEYVKKK